MRDNKNTFLFSLFFSSFLSVIVNCSSAVRNFYIESSLGTFLAEKSSVPERSDAVDQISKVKQKMGRQRIKRRRRRRRRRRKKRSLRENPLEVLLRRTISTTTAEEQEEADNRVTSVKARDEDEGGVDGVDNGASESVKNATEVTAKGRQKWQSEEAESAVQYVKVQPGDTTNELWTSGRTGSEAERRRRRRESDEGESRQRSGAFLVDAANNVGDSVNDDVPLRGRTRVKRATEPEGVANCRNKNVWIENFVYSPEFSVKWRFSESDLRERENQTNMVISFR